MPEAYWCDSTFGLYTCRLTSWCSSSVPIRLPVLWVAPFSRMKCYRMSWMVANIGHLTSYHLLIKQYVREKSCNYDFWITQSTSSSPHTTSCSFVDSQPVGSPPLFLQELLLRLKVRGERKFSSPAIACLVCWPGRFSQMEFIIDRSQTTQIWDVMFGVWLRQTQTVPYIWLSLVSSPLQKRKVWCQVLFNLLYSEISK